MDARSCQVPQVEAQVTPMDDPKNFYPGFLPPTLILPTQERVKQYTDSSFNYSAYLKDLRQRGPLEGGELQFENIITQCIEGEFREALDGLLNIPEDQLDSFQQIAYLRLVGGLLEDLGNTDRSRIYLQRALDLSKTIGAKNVVDHARNDTGLLGQRSTTSQRGHLGTMRRFLRREVSISLEGQDLSDDAAFHRYEAALKIDAPAFLGYQEYAQSVADAQMIEEEFKASLREEGSFYSRSGFPSEIAWVNLSLWMAYTCGDTRRARYTRTTFGRWAVLHGQRGDNNNLVAAGVQELIRSRVLNEMETLLSRVGHLIHAQMDVNAYFQSFRPLQPSGPAAAPMWRILHMLVKTMVGYANDESRRSLRATYSEGLRRYMAGEPGMAADPTYAVSYFIEAYSQLGPTADDIERLLTWASEKQIGPGRIHNLWALVKTYKWDGSQERPLAERAIDLLKILHPKGEPEEYASLFNILSQALDTNQRDALDSWIAQHLSPSAQFNYWVDSNHKYAEPLIFPTLQNFIAQETQELRDATRGSSLSFGGPIISSYITAVFANYQEVEDDSTRIAIIHEYLNALANTHIHARVKADGYSYISEAMRYVSDEVKAATRDLIIDRKPALEQSQEIRRGFFREIGRPIDAQLALWRLRARVGLFSNINDLPLLTVALSDARAGTRRTAAETATVVLKEQGQDMDVGLWYSTQALLYSRVFDENAWVRRAAITGLIYSGGIFDPLWGNDLLQRAKTLVQTDQPVVASSILWTLSSQAKEWRTTPNNTVLSAIEALAEVGQINPHRDVRMAAIDVTKALTALTSQTNTSTPGL